MDSMRSLNTSLPRTSPRRQMAAKQPPEDLLSAFRAAALSVTTLYKTAASDQTRVRAAGYQDALDDLLTFLDKANLGLGDGEGWRVRQWATERLDGSSAGRGESDEEEDEVAEDEKPVNSASEPKRDVPAPQHHHASTPPQQQQQQPQQDTIVIQPQAPPTDSSRYEPPTVLPSGTFTFRSQHAYPSNHDREEAADNMSVSSETHTQHHNSTETPVRVEVLRSRNRPTRPNRATTSGRANLGSGAGSKRKTPFGDFFDLSGLSFDNNKDGHDRGGKRGRHV